MLGRSVGNYRLISKIGQGGMGVVYLAEHKTLGRRAAVKVLVPELSSNQDIVSRFFNEARATTAIRNPGIVEVFDFGFLDDRSAYIVMEYLDGESLAARIRKARPKVPATLVILRAIARALQAAHELGIVHRDLKPDNVFLVPDSDLPSGERIKLLDFGIAKLNAVMGQTGHTRTGTVMGTPTYMAPEQCRGAGSVDHRADLYALGCIAYEMLCGQPPFVAEGAGEIIARHLYFEPAPPRSLRASLRPEVEELVLRLLQKDPVARPSTATEVIHVIDRLVANAPTVAPRIEPADPEVSVRRRRSEPLGMPAIVDGPRHDAADLVIVAGRTRDEPADPLVVLRRRRDEPLAPTIPAGPPRNQAADPAVGRDRRREQKLAPTVPAVRRRSEPRAKSPGRPPSEAEEPVAPEGRRPSEPLDTSDASGRRRNQPLDRAVTSDRSGGRIDPPAEPDRPRIASADPAGAAGRRRTESTDRLVASYRRLSESLDRQATSPRPGMMNTTLSGAVVSDVNTSVPTVLRSRLARIRIAAAGVAVMLLLVVVTGIRLAGTKAHPEESGSIGLAISSTSRSSAGVAVTPSAGGSTNPASPQSGAPPSQLDPMPSEPAQAPHAPDIVTGGTAPLPPSDSLPERKDSTIGRAPDPLDGPIERRPSAKPFEDGTSSDGGTVDDKPRGSRHPRPGKVKPPDPAKQVIPDPSNMGTPAAPSKSTQPEDTKATEAAGPVTQPHKIFSPLQLSCQVNENSASPGQKLHINCDATNTNDTVIRITAVEVTVGTSSTPQAAVGAALPELMPHGSIHIEVTPTLPADIDPGELPILITITTPDSEAAKRPVVVQVVEKNQ